MSKLKAAVFAERGRIVPESRPIPHVRALCALLRVCMTTICGKDVTYPSQRLLRSQRSHHRL